MFGRSSKGPRSLLAALLALTALVPALALAGNVKLRALSEQAQQTTATYQFSSGPGGCARVYLFISTETDTAVLDVKLQGQDPQSLTWVDVPGASFAQKTAVTSDPVSLTVCPGIAETANETVNDALPNTVRVVAVATTGAGSGTFVYSLGAQTIP